jgi:sec-independent protein translocase protein TatA
MGAPELLIVLLIIVVFFGATKRPKLARSFGEAQREFKKGQDEGESDEDPKAS